MRNSSFILVAVAFALVPHRVFSQASFDEAVTETKRIHPVRTDTAPEIDGSLDDWAWQTAVKVDDLHQINPQEFDPPWEPTRVFVTYDDRALYVAAELAESNAITARVLRQGEDISDDDFFGVIIDPFFDKRNGFQFQVNPNGVRKEALFQNTTRTQTNWQGIWRAETSITERGWIAEIAIPLNTISFDPASETWGINFTRQRAEAQETLGWVSRNRQQNPSISGIAQGLAGLNQGLGIDIVPSVIVTESTVFGESAGSTTTDPSLDISYKFTPALTGLLTLNTDFSAAEVDDRQVNLTRFSLFFPEKRDFFLQDADIFEFGRIGVSAFAQNAGNGRPFFSRRIGLSATRQPVDIDAGAKLTGRVGTSWNLGLLSVRQDAFEDVAPTTLTVGRAVRNVLGESTVGVILTSGDPQSNRDNSLIGFDFRYLNTRLANGSEIQAEAWYQSTDTPGLNSEDSAYGVGFELPNRTGWKALLDYVEIEEHFNPALGFANRRGIREFNGALGYNWRPRDKYLRNYRAEIDTVRSSRLADGSLQSESTRFSVLGQNYSSDEIQIGVKRDREGLSGEFEIVEGIIIPPGIYDFDRYWLRLRTGGQRKLSGELRYEGGDYFDGRRTTVAPTMTWRPVPHFSLGMSFETNSIDIPQGEFTVRQSRLELGSVFSSKLSWTNLIQWDNVSDEIGFNSRFHWIPEAGRELFIVLNHTLLADLQTAGFQEQSFISLRRDLTAKFSYNFRF